MRKIVRERILEKCNHQCIQCGAKEKLEVDHIIPLSVGGREDEDNMQILCRSCNAKKHNKSEYKGIIALDSNCQDYILINSEKALQLTSSPRSFKPFHKHITEVLQNPHKYLRVYGVQDGEN